ncbi:MAG TPA: acyl carrier protein, partial [Actinomycetota bacterium]|nr:acyl carrier protein [Actinomycetota bacterium]
MNENRAREIVLAALMDVAPELEPESVDPDMSLRNGADLDSMDFLAYVSAVAEAIEADVPEDDYEQLDTVNAAVAY